MKNKKKIVFFIGSMIIGGIEKSLIELLNIIDYEKFTVIVYLKDNQGDMHELINSKAIIKFWGDECVENTRNLMHKYICRVEFCKVFKGIYNRILARKHRNSYELSLMYSIKCMELIDDEIYDCVIAFHGANVQVMANVLSRVRAKKRILWIHGRDIRPDSLLRYYDCEYAKFDYVICVSEAVRKFFVEKYPRAGKKSLVVHNCINLPAIRKAANEKMEDKLKTPSIMTVGRLSKEKGQDMIPRTAKLLIEMGCDFTWYLVGEGDLRETIEREIAEYDVSSHVILIGGKLNPYPYIGNCDIYVQPSLSEGCCVAVQEAKVLCKPIVVTKDVSFFEQIANGVNGLIAEGKTPEDLSVAIAELLENCELREKFKNGLKNEEYSNHNELQILYEILEQ